MFTHDLKSHAILNGWMLPEQKGTEHNALDDARWVREAYRRYCV